MIKLAYAEEAPYWRTSQSSPDAWIDRAKRQIVGVGGHIRMEAFGHEPATGRAAFVLAFQIGSDHYRLTWPVLPSRTGNDRAARWVLERAAVLLARALAGALALLNPDMVVFGGGVSLCFPLIQETFDRELRLRTPVFSIEKTVITHSKFGDRAGVLGAALLPVERGEH